MFKKLLFNRKNKGNIMTFLSTAVIVSASSMVKSDAASYYIRTVFDEGSFGMISQVISEKTLDEGESLERKDNINYSAILDYRKVYKGGGNNDVPGSSLIANIVQGNKVATQLKKDEEEKNARAKEDEELGAVVTPSEPNSEATSSKVKEIYKAFTSGDAEDGENKGLLFTFPGLRETEQLTYVGMSADAARAELVANTLTKGMNDALAFIQTYSEATHAGGDGLRHVVAQLARITSQFPDKALSSFNSGGAAGNKGFSVHHVTGKGMTFDGCGSTVGEELIPVNGLRYSDYLVISTRDKTTGKIVYGYYPWRMQKGYYDTNKNLKGPLEETVGPEYAEESRKKENAYITWGQMAMQAGVNADIRGTQSVDAARDTMTLIGQGLGADLTSTITSVRSLLNLAPVQELILNMGSRSVTHYYGVMTQDMYNTSKTVYVLILAVSLLALGALIVKMIHQKMISTTNIIAKTSLMEGLQDIMFVAVMLALFPSIFELLLELNFWIVKTFSFSSSYLQAYGISGAKALGLESLAGFMVSSMYLSIDAYINTTYLVRAIVVSFLFAIAPMMIISYAWGPMQKKLFFSYMRELIGNIFMQSFHAITMCFFAGYNTTNMSAMEAIASTYCFIPITQLFRSLVIGSQGGFSEQLGGKLAGQLTNTAMGMHKANISMKQSQELNDMMSKNSRNAALAGGLSQTAATAADIFSSATMQNLANGEIGNTASKIGGNKSKAGDKSGGSSPGSALRGVAKAALPGLAASGIGALATGATEKSNRTNLGEMQMKHSMENLGMGLAQAGIGLGVSSYDASGGGMVSAGMSTAESAAGKYGEGISNKTTAGTNYGWAKTADTMSTLGNASLRNAGKDYLRAESRNAMEQKKLADAEKAQDNKEKSIGLDYELNEHGRVENHDVTANYMNLQGKNGEYKAGNSSPIARFENHNSHQDNSTIVFNAERLKEIQKDKNSQSDSSLMQLAHMAANGQMGTPEYEKMLKKANSEYGASKDISPIITKDSKGDVKEVAIVLERMSSKLGMEVDSNGRTYASSPSMKNNIENTKNKTENT